MQGIVIQGTTNYGMFRYIGANRGVKDGKLRQMISSIKQNGQLVPIQANENMEITDGQHRVAACKHLRKPVYYYVVPGVGVEQIREMNTTQTNWSVEDYLHHHLTLGVNPHYVTYKWFRDKYGFKHHEALKLLCDVLHTVEAGKAWKAGSFKVKNLEKAKDIAEMLTKVSEVYDGYNRRGFIDAFFKVIRRRVFNFDTFMKKMRQQPTVMRDCAKGSQYIELIEKVYNYRNPNPVNLRFGD